MSSLTPRGGSPDSAAASPQYRELTPEQYHQGYILPGGYRAWPGPILRVTERGTYIVREPVSRV